MNMEEDIGIFSITDNAAKQIKSILSENPNKLLKVGVLSGGCSGLTYSMDLVTENDLEDDDEILNQKDLKIAVDGMSVMFLIGTELDYVTELIGSQFVFNNPSATMSCGCGNSFGV